jgi:hypothetical protein
VISFLYIAAGDKFSIKEIVAPHESKLKGKFAEGAPATKERNFNITGFKGEVVNKPGQAEVTNMLSETRLIKAINAK